MVKSLIVLVQALDQASSSQITISHKFWTCMTYMTLWGLLNVHMLQGGGMADGGTFLKIEASAHSLKACPLLLFVNPAGKIWFYKNNFLWLWAKRQDLGQNLAGWQRLALSLSFLKG